MKNPNATMKTSIHYPLVARAFPLLVCLALMPLAAYSQTANPPGQMSYQGFLTDATGNALAMNSPSNYNVIFRIYVTPTAGTALWGEIQTVTIDRGYFSVLLGQGASDGNGDPWTNNLASLFAGANAANASDRYVGITVKGITSPDTEVAPRLRLLSSPYAFLASTALNAPDTALSANVALRAGGNTFTGNQTINSGGLTVAQGISAYGSITANGNVSAGGNVTASGSMSANGAVTAGSFAGNSGNIALSGNTTIAGSAAVTGNATVSGNATVTGNVSAGSFTGASLGLSGNATVSGNAAVTGSVSAGSFAGNGTIPIGGIIMWSGSIASIPAGWALCNGQTVNTHVTPNLQNQFIVGAGTGTGASYGVGATGGSYPVTLTVAQLPAHSHTVNFGEGGGKFYAAVSNGDFNYSDLWSSGSYVSTGTTGSGQAFDNRPPYYALAYIMRVQ